MKTGKWKVFRPADGLAHRAVLSLALDKDTGDVWVGTMGGLSRMSGGRIDTFTQLNSGLSNDIVYGVGVQGDLVWTATAAGASRLNTRTGQWALFNERNTPMYEIWTYSVSPGTDKVYYAVWGGGLLEYDVASERWKDYNDPDGETQLVLFKDQGLIHEITTSVSYIDKIVWVATYFGASRYDGRNWHNFLTKDSGLPSNFLSQIKGVDGNRAWFSTDKGLAYYDGTNWAVYRPALDTWQAGDDGARCRWKCYAGGGGFGARAQLHPGRGFSRRRSLGGYGERFESRHTAEIAQSGTTTNTKETIMTVAELLQEAAVAPVQKRAITNLNTLNEAYDYGSAFSRGMRIDLGKFVLLLISGTASIDEQGKTVHVGDLRAQTRRTFENITRLLESEGATWKDIVRTTCYLRDIERDYQAFNEERSAFYGEQGLNPLPASTGIQAILCRPDLLIEIEAIAMFRRETPEE